MGKRAFLFLAAALVPAACVANLDGFTSGAPALPDASNDATSDVVAESESGASLLDAGTEAEASSPATDGGCKGAAGPAMVRLGKYCIDTTEVTGAQYSAFLASAPDIAGQPPACAFNTSYVPKDTVQSDNFPARAIDWCDAHAYCAWAGKRLCGGIGGGPASFDNYAAITDEWYSACSNSGQLAYPYGNTYEPLYCNTLDVNDAGEPAVVASFPKCVGSQPGLFDLSGNVREWQDACDPNLQGGAEDCVTRGGGADDPQSAVSCTSHAKDQRNYASKHVGFRCCSD